METLYGGDAAAHAAELARHFAETQTVLGTEKLVRYSLVAGQRSLAAHAWEDAQRGPASKGIASIGSQPVPDGQAAALLFGLGSAQFTTVVKHEIPDAVAWLRCAFDHYTEAGEVDRAVAVAQHQLPMTVFYLAGTAQMAQQALALVQRDSHDEGRLLPQYAKAVYFEENDYEAARYA